MHQQPSDCCGKPQCTPNTRLPLPLCFSEASIQRQLGHLLSPCTSRGRDQPIHTALVPALLYVPAFYVPISSACVSCESSRGHRRADSAVVVNEDSRSCGKKDVECKVAPWFESAARQFADVQGQVRVQSERAKMDSRARLEWECDFCGLECFCEGLPG